MMKNTFKSIVAAFLALEARAVLWKYKPKVVAVTGTVGKTSTKDAIYTALSRTLSVRKTKKSQNSEFGLPLTILGQDNPVETIAIFSWLKVLARGLDLIVMPHHYPEWLVLEIGADHPGDIQAAVAWVHPSVSVVTKLSKVPVHVEFFPSVEEVAREKSYLVRALKEGGTAVLNADDEDVRAFKDLTKARTIFFGSSHGSDVVPEGYEVVSNAAGLPEGMRFLVLCKPHERVSITLTGTLGRHLIYPIIAALAVAEAVGESMTVAAEAFREYEPTPGRMRLVDGKSGSMIIDDTYNSSPVALEEALKTLGDSTHGHRRVAVLGDMLELGKYSIDEHKKAGRLAAEHADILITIGQRMTYAAEFARMSGMQEVHEFDDSAAAGRHLAGIIASGDIILVKGSQGVRAERVVQAVMAHPEEAEKLLVRQDKEWQARDKRRGKSVN